MKRTNDYLIEGTMIIIGAGIATGVAILFEAAKEAAISLYEKAQELREGGEE